MDALEAIKNRRSIRKYTGDVVPSSDLEEIVNAGRLAASGNNKQPWDFVIVTDRLMIKRLSTAAKWSENAGAMIAVVLDPSTKYWIEDGSAAIENMLIAATALGYGSCWIQGNIQPYERNFKLLLNIPDDLNLLAIITVGVPVERVTKEKKDLSEVLHWETF